MKNRYLLALGTAVAAALVLSPLSLTSHAQDATNPGLVPNTGQINTGMAAQPSFAIGRCQQYPHAGRSARGLDGADLQAAVDR